jgi:hypothetical protein
MHEKISERSEGNMVYHRVRGEITEFCAVLDDRIDELAEILQEYYNISDIGDPGSSTEVNYHFLLPLIT